MFYPSHPHLLCVGTARRSVQTACGPTAHSSEPIFHRRSHTRKRSASILRRAASPRAVRFILKMQQGGNPGQAYRLKITASDCVRPYLFTGISSGFTLPQSGPLYNEVACIVMSIGRVFGPICIVPVICIVVSVELPSVQVD